MTVHNPDPTDALEEIPDSGEIIRLSPEDQRRVAEAILNPPEPTGALVRAFERYMLITKRCNS